MKIDLLKIMIGAKKIYRESTIEVGICSVIRYSIINYERQYLFGSVFNQHCSNTKPIKQYNSHISIIEDHIKTKIHKPPKHYYPLKARNIIPYNKGYWWQLYDIESRLKRLDEYIEYFSKPENRYLEV